MNLRDLERSTRAAFGECDGCSDCSSCRAFALVEMAWNAGRRSGRASSAERKLASSRFDEWGWSDSVVDALITYTIEIAHPSRFHDRFAVAEFVGRQLGGAREWALSKGEKRENWTMFAKGWIRRELDSGRASTSTAGAQAELFTSRSAQSVDSAARRRETFRLLKG